MLKILTLQQGGASSEVSPCCHCFYEGVVAVKQDIMLVCLQTENLNELQSALEQSKMLVTQLDGTQNAILSMVQHSPAFLLLDFDVENAANLLQEISNSLFFRPPPYIVIAAAFSEGHGRATMFDLGADACIEKPIDPAEVVSLIHAVLRREHKIVRLNIGRLLPCIEHKDLAIDPTRRIVTMRNVPIALSPKEFDILLLLAEHAGTILSPEAIYEAIWKADYRFANNCIIDNIHSIRKKLGLNSRDSQYIETIHRIGYRFNRSE